MTVLDDARLAMLLRSYGTFGSDDQARILAIVVKNYRRSIRADDRARAARWDNAFDEVSNRRRDLSHVLATADHLSGGVPALRLRPGSLGLLADLGAAVASLPPVGEPHLGLALALHGHGLSPVIAYSFNAWQVDADSSLLLGRRLAELAVMGLYRLVEERAAVRPGIALASGAVADLVRSSGGRVTKLPRNYAARTVLLPGEYENFGRLACAGLDDRIPGRVSFDTGAAALSRDYIEGTSGETVLRERRELSPRQHADLRDLHGLLLGVMKDGGSILDLHPGNFVWNEQRGRWILVDLGSVPRTGAEEYTQESFDAYFQYTWLDRLRREHDEPIRSLDYDLGLVNRA